MSAAMIEQAAAQRRELIDFVRETVEPCNDVQDTVCHVRSPFQEAEARGDIRFGWREQELFALLVAARCPSLPGPGQSLPRRDIKSAPPAQTVYAPQRLLRT